MKPEDRFLFLAARQHLQPDHIRRMQTIAATPGFDWGLLFTVASDSGIAPLVYKHVTDLPALTASVPGALLAEYRLYTLHNTFYKKERARQLSQAIHFFNQRGIPAIIFKGAAQDLMVYEEPWYTNYFDIDLILRPRKEALSAEFHNEIGNKFYRKRLEFDFFEHHDMTINGMLPIDFESVWQLSRPVDCYGEPALVLSPEDHLIAICINSCRKRFFRLKSLLDIHEIILKWDPFDWEKFCARCRSFGCGNIVYTALLVARLTLETPLPERLIPQLGLSPARAAIIRAGGAYFNEILASVREIHPLEGL